MFMGVPHALVSINSTAAWVGLSGVTVFASIPALRFGTRLRRAPTIPNVRSLHLLCRLRSCHKTSFCKFLWKFYQKTCIVILCKAQHILL